VSAFAYVLHLVRAPGGARRLAQVGVLRRDGKHLAIEEVQPW